ncbi:MAG: 1-acyl-sn-glycerol-3-phosphate acyltransferase [Flavobacteriales bacterium]|nr:1-acyl-sn-glycerol-3-phosphate acyltransferase [Flavobacteriales bacterium]
MHIQRVANFMVLAGVKLWSRLFYRVENEWVHAHESDPWAGMKVLALLNHTSLFEPLFLGAAPWRMLWRIAGRIIAPGADVTMNRPLAGWILSFIAPRMVPISRERDETWDNFLKAILPESVVIILPEGRMMRADGLDKNGKPMSVRGGVADILEMMPDGELVFVYSGGLHHVQAPGQMLPKFFKRIRMRSEKVNIKEYVKAMKNMPDVPYKKAVTRDMEARLAKYKPQ